MTIEQLRNLKVGDRVQWIKDGSTGTVTEKKFGFSRIKWDDGVKDTVIGWRSEVDRARGRNLQLLPVESKL